MANVMGTNKLYRVRFTIDDSYTPKAETFRVIEIVVSAPDQFKSLSIAWEKLSVLNLPEPKEFNATRVGKDE